jgi:hypothetical protein
MSPGELTLEELRRLVGLQREQVRGRAERIDALEASLQALVVQGGESVSDHPDGWLTSRGTS